MDNNSAGGSSDMSPPKSNKCAALSTIDSTLSLSSSVPIRRHSWLNSLSDDLLYTVLKSGSVRELGLLRTTCSWLSSRCSAHEPRLYQQFLCSKFDVLVSETEECGDAGFSLVKLAIPCLTLVVEIRGKTHATKRCQDDGERARRKPWDGDFGSIQELFYGVSSVKAGSYKEAFQMCLRKKVEDSLGKAQLAVNQNQLSRQKLEFAMGAIKMEYSLLVHAFSKIKADRQMRERQDILNRAKAREPNAWASAPVRWAGQPIPTIGTHTHCGEQAAHDPSSQGACADVVVQSLADTVLAGIARGASGMEQSLALDIASKKTLLLAKRKELDVVQAEGARTRHELKGLERHLRKLGGPVACHSSAPISAASSLLLARRPGSNVLATSTDAAAHDAHVPDAALHFLV